MRKFNAYELNQLIKFGFDPFEIAKTADENIPVEYITGKAEFLDNIFEIDFNTLIPRIETEELIYIALKHIKDENLKSINFIDVGTGSGVIGITFALNLIKLNIQHFGILIDIYEKILEITKKNVLKFLPSSKINFEIEYSDNIIKKNISTICIYKSENNISRKLISLKNKFVIIFANLPYIPTERINKLDDSVTKFEPLTALDGGEDGLAVIREVLNKYREMLSNNGVFILEVDDSHTQNMTIEFLTYWDIEVKKDLNDKVRYWICKKNCC